MWYVLTFVIGVLVGAIGCIALRAFGYTRSLRERLEKEINELCSEAKRYLDGEAQVAALDFLARVKYVLKKIL